MNKKFYFVPLQSYKKDEPEMYFRIYKPGTIRFGEKIMKELGITKEGVMMSFYQDIERRAFGFKIIQKVDLVNNKNFRFVKPLVNSKGYVFCQISIQPFIRTLGDVVFPAPRLYVEEYEDKDSYINLGKLYYITIPKGKQISENKENE